MAERTETISFRLPASFLKQLEQKAAEYNATLGKRRKPLSRGDFARRVLIEALADTERDRWQEELGELRRELARFRDDFETATLALLVHAGKTKTAEAKKWVSEHFRG